eukprot:CAMPEP_0203897766 /NCGR_PEP_ID=MMETSP0359-20131031/40368_1 /ASSEMBLY_ACC=CAM_ASM_000338 /TAXON_ID=268821 /ORGANISM="Scrippsiella Hangoei, Strain SHTV-5" /LENGTH=47 /DNA_ID= /DNA_START= /DNA_END= /DNA_ORIENTATION=
MAKAQTALEPLGAGQPWPHVSVSDTQVYEEKLPYSEFIDPLTPQATH